MIFPLLTMEIRQEQDMVLVRQRTRQLAGLLGLTGRNLTRLATAVSEIARNAFGYARGACVEFLLDQEATPRRFLVRFTDQGPGIADLVSILEGKYKSKTGMGLGILGARRLTDYFHMESAPGQGTRVELGLNLPLEVTIDLPRLSRDLTSFVAENPLEELKRQNQELVQALAELRQREEELVSTNRELAETNRGVLALHSELVKNNARLENVERMLRERNEELKGFAYTVSHDLKAPLRGISGYAQELEQRHRSGLSERALFCLTQILTATRNLDHLIEDLLQYSRLDRLTFVTSAIDLPKLIDAILKDRSLLIQEQGVEITLALLVTQLHSWERGLSQVLANLVDNALKYSRNARPPRIDITAEEGPDHIRIAVRDNGIGFDMKYCERIFGLFNRLVRPDEFEGTGAGLAIVKKLLDKMDGVVRAEAAPGQGATFFVTLPKSGSARTGGEDSSSEAAKNA